MNPDGGIVRRRHILHLIDALNVGGAQELLVLLAKCSPKEHYRTSVCVLQPNLEMRAKLESHGARVICFNRPRPSILKPHRLISYFYRNVRDIVAFCRREHVDVLQCHLSDAEFIGIFAGHLAGTERVLTTLHDPKILPVRRSSDPRNVLRRLVTRLLYKWTDAVVAVSDELAERITRFVHFDPAKIHVIINGIDAESLGKTPFSGELASKLGLKPGDRVLLTAARLTLQKGHVYLLEALDRLLRSHPQTVLLLAGDGELKEELMGRCRAMGVPDHVRFLGSRSDVPDLLALADVFVLPSLWEGTSLALLEAMAAAKPIVATDIPGNRETLMPRNCGLLVPPGDSAALARGMAELLDHPDAGREYGRRAAEVVAERFDVRRSIEQLELLWGT